MKEKKPFRTMLCVAAAFLISCSPMLAGHIYDIGHPVTTLAGHDALIQIHGYLGCLLFELAAMPFAFALGGFVGSLIYKSGKEGYKGRRRWSPAAVVILALLGSALLLFIPRVSGLDLQQKLNGCEGPPIMRIARLYSDCGKDIQSGAVRRVEIENAETGCEIFTYRKPGNSKGSSSMGYRTQHSLKNGGEPVAQVTLSDRNRLEILFTAADRHSAELYENSGLLASFDGYDAIPSDFSALLALEYDGEFVRIKDAENKGGLKDVSLHLEYEGKRIKDMPAGSHTEFYFPEMQKGAICYLQIMHFGKPLRVSNIIEF